MTPPPQHLAVGPSAAETHWLGMSRKASCRVAHAWAWLLPCRQVQWLASYWVKTPRLMLGEHTKPFAGRVRYSMQHLPWWHVSLAHASMHAEVMHMRW